MPVILSRIILRFELGVQYFHLLILVIYSWLPLEDDSASSSVDVVQDIGPVVKETATAQMDAAIVALSRELAKLRTGRASPGI